MVPTAAATSVALSDDSCSVPTTKTEGTELTVAGGRYSCDSAYRRMGLEPRPAARDARSSVYVALVPRQLMLYATVSIHADVTLVSGPSVSCEADTLRLAAKALVMLATRVEAADGTAIIEETAVMLTVSVDATMWLVIVAPTVVLVVLARLYCSADLLKAVRFTEASVRLKYGHGMANIDVICFVRMLWYASGTTATLETRASIAVCTAGMQVASAVVTFVLAGRRMGA